MIGGGSAKDLFTLSMPLVHQTTKGAYARATRPSRIAAGEVTECYIVTGQSLAGAWNGGTYVPTNTAKIDQVNIEDGGVYVFADPPLGIDSGILDAVPQTGSWMGRFADLRINSGACARVIFIPCAVGGRAISDFQPGGLCFERLLVACRRAAALDLPIKAALLQQGEADHGLLTSQATYQAGLVGLTEGIAEAGFPMQWIIAKSSVLANVQYNPVRLGVNAVINGGNIFAGPDIDQYVGPTYRLTDGTHLSATGLDYAAAGWDAAVTASGL